MKKRYNIELTTAIASAIGFLSHFLVGSHYINLLTFGILSLITSLLFGLVGRMSGNRALLISQIGWSLIAISTIMKNIQ